MRLPEEMKYGTQKCGICSKELIPGDYVYGVCHDCAKRAISQRLKDVKSYAAIAKRLLPK